MPFGMWGAVGDSHHVLDWGSGHPRVGAILGWGRDRPIVKYRDNGARAVKRRLVRSRWRLASWSAVGPSNHVLDGGPDPPMVRGNFWGDFFLSLIHI